MVYFRVSMVQKALKYDPGERNVVFKPDNGAGSSAAGPPRAHEQNKLRDRLAGNWAWKPYRPFREPGEFYKNYLHHRGYANTN